MKSGMIEDFNVGDPVRRTDTERSGQIVKVLPGHAARVQWPGGQEDWLPLSLLTHADSKENEQ